MIKANIELFNVRSNFKVKFSLILKDDNPENNSYRKLVNKFKIAGNEYLQLNPYPFVVFDISSRKDKKENGYSSNDTISFTRKHLFLLLKKIEALLKEFREPDLFYYNDDHELMVNKEKAEKFRKIHKTSSKTILIQPCVVRDEESNIDYEGCFLAINSMDHYVEITYTELQFLFHELSKVDFTSYSLQIINSAELFNKMEAAELKITNSAPKEEYREIEMVDTKKRIRIEESHEIPEI